MAQQHTSSRKRKYLSDVSRQDWQDFESDFESLGKELNLPNGLSEVAEDDIWNLWDDAGNVAEVARRSR